MHLSVFKAMADSKTPEKFLDLVLKAVKNNEWSYEQPTPAELAQWERDEAKYRQVVFITDKNNLIYFNVGR